ncbi:hypothetical protein ACET3Z_003335 [Daucus carota]
MTPADDAPCLSMQICVSSQRCAELTIIVASHGRKEVLISYQHVYLLQYMPSIGFCLMDKVKVNVDYAIEHTRTVKADDIMPDILRIHHLTRMDYCLLKSSPG